MCEAATTLEPDQFDSYWRDGFVFPIRVLSEADALRYRRALEDIEAAWSDADLPAPLSHYLRVNAQCVLPLATELAMHAAVLDAVESILGPDLLIWSAEFFVKESRSGHVVSMHQDLTYWGLGETSDQVTAWIALSPSTVRSGCMDFVRGSHRSPILPHNDTFADANMLSRGQEIAVEVSEADKTSIVLEPGQMSLHHGLTIHGSGPNRSRDRRIGFAIRYLSPKAKQKVADRDYAIVARGVDSSGHFIHYAPPGRLFAPRSLELYEQIRSDQAKALTAGAALEVSLYQPSIG